MNPITAIIGTFYPAQFIAEKILRQTLFKSGLNPTEYPIKKLATYAVDMAKFQGRMMREWYRVRLYDSALGVAHCVYFIRTGESDFLSAANLIKKIKSGEREPIWEILNDFNPESYSLDNITITQSEYQKQKRATF